MFSGVGGLGGLSPGKGVPGGNPSSGAPGLKLDPNP